VCGPATGSARANRPALAACLDACAASLRAQYPEMGRDVAVDASDLSGFANGQRFVSKNGPERERFSDPDASWGHRSAVSTRKGGGFYGYKIHAAVCASTGLPLAWRIETARNHESVYLPPLLEALCARGFRPETVAADRGYDSTLNHDECRIRSILPVIPRRVDDRHKKPLPLFADGSRNPPWIPQHSERFKSLYRGRAAVERESVA
jgi:hypothetical protein